VTVTSLPAAVHAGETVPIDHFLLLPVCWTVTSAVEALPRRLWLLQPASQKLMRTTISRPCRCASLAAVVACSLVR